MIPFKQSFLLHLGHVLSKRDHGRKGISQVAHAQVVKLFEGMYICIYFFGLRREDVTSMKCKHVVTLQINQIVPGCWLIFLFRSILGV